MKKFKSVDELISQLQPDKPVYCIRKKSIQVASRYFQKKLITLQDIKNMIKFRELKQEEPYIMFKEKYDEAFNAKQKNIEAMSISSFSKELNEVNSRFGLICE